MFNLFARSKNIEDVSKEIFKSFTQDFDYFAINYFQQDSEKFNMTLKGRDTHVLSVSKNNQLLYKKNNSYLNVNESQESKIKFLLDKMIREVLFYFQDILRLGTDFQNEENLKPLEWMKTTSNNLIKVIQMCNTCEDKFAAYSFFFKKDRNELILSVFNYDFVITISGEPKMIVTVYQNQVDESELNLSSDPVFVHEFRDRSLEVFDMVTNITREMTRQKLLFN